MMIPFSTKKALGVLQLLFLLHLDCHSLTVTVFGGSGFTGRRICQRLVNEEGVHVLSISRSGKPPSYYCDPSWSDQVDWIQMDFDTEEKMELPQMDVAISCVGNIQPRPEWVKSSFFGLGFDDDKLRYENGVINERICQAAKDAGAQRFVFISVSYEVAKALEGPIEGYLDGKRRAEHAACKRFGPEKTIVIGPSLVYGGKRFPTLGKVYRAFVESPIAKAYIAGNDALRSLSIGDDVEDWVEKMLFSSPVDVHVVAKVVAASALGQVTRAMTGSRKQGFFNTRGKPVTYDDVLFVDGTQEIERIADQVQLAPFSPLATAIDKNEPPNEGALIGKKPFLYPLPVVATFAAAFYGVATNSFVPNQNALGGTPK